MERVNLESMVGSPLLPFLLHTVLRDHYTLKTQTSDHRFAETHTDVHGLHSFRVGERVHEAMTHVQINLFGSNAYGRGRNHSRHRHSCAGHDNLFQLKCIRQICVLRMNSQG